ncbi:hypothetical protein IW261DRAFT_1558700 [Armillaria novae-zelandiae]|uniref:Uncharacterized protein n=1 Tax=Armillaria novae-zelandiae TaxID=153914 RepID=A0AA39PNL9_9AGAR|nr:hypothetical protein IW261DRAFT_1558700 [Armillaria novae-zelandiae]
MSPPSNVFNDDNFPTYDFCRGIPHNEGGIPLLAVLTNTVTLPPLGSLPQEAVIVDVGQNKIAYIPAAIILVHLRLLAQFSLSPSLPLTHHAASFVFWCAQLCDVSYSVDFDLWRHFDVMEKELKVYQYLHNHQLFDSTPVSYGSYAIPDQCWAAMIWTDGEEGADRSGKCGFSPQEIPKLSSTERALIVRFEGLNDTISYQITQSD